MKLKEESTTSNMSSNPENEKSAPWKPESPSTTS